MSSIIVRSGWRCVAVVLGLLCGMAHADIPAGKKVVGYLPDYRLSELASINFSNVTHVCYFSLDADTQGNLVATSSFSAGLPQVVAKVHAAGRKVSVCVGGWLTDSYFSPIANSATARANFVSQLVAFCRVNNLDGVDLDWEPVATADVAPYSALITQLKTALAPYGLLLSVAVNFARYELQPSVATSLDWVSVMAYDMNYPHADHSTYADAVAAMTFWSQSGIDKGKLLMGVPFYGLDEGWANAATYAQLIDQYNPALSVNNVGGFGFNGASLVQAKAAYAMGAGFGGMMVWELGQDKFDSRSLLTALVAGMGQPVAVPSLPLPWLTRDIGTVGLIGSASATNGLYTVAGAGYGIGGRADDFRYLYQTLTGDGEIRVRFRSQTGTAAGAMAGVMIRESLNSDSRFVMLEASPAKTFGVVVRSSTGGKASTSSGGNLNTAPNNWMRLVRSGNTFTAYKSADGATWTKITSTTVSMAASITIGVSVTSSTTAALNTAAFDNFSVVP